MWVEIVTRPNDRWDLIAFRMYGDPWAFERIVAANRDVPIRPVLPGGITIRVPVIDAPTATATDVPPWRRA